MGNYLKMVDKQRIQAVLELSWSDRRIQQATGVRRETVARYDPKRDSKPAKVYTGPKSAAEPYRGQRRPWRHLRRVAGWNVPVTGAQPGPEGTSPPAADRTAGP